MPQLLLDLIDNADLTARFEDGVEIVRATRTAEVRGLTVNATPAEAASALARALVFVRTRCPPHSVYDPRTPHATLEGYRCIGVSENSDLVRILLSYDTVSRKTGAGQGGGTIVLSDDASEVVEQTQLDPATGAPIYCKWVNPRNAKDVVGGICTISYPRTIRTLVVSGIILTTNIDKYRKAQGAVNGDPFLGDRPGYWAFKRLRSSQTVGTGFSEIVAELSSRITEDWSTYAILRNRDTGLFVNIDPQKSAKLRNDDYVYGMRGPDSAGVVKIGTRPKVRFSDLFKLGRGTLL